ncbi:MAG: hypothetical protein ACFHWX_09185 [Bacteroidota bacterium]
MTDPFRRSIRKYVPLDVYQQLFENELYNSLIYKDINTITESGITSRMNKLDQMEQTEGFVFVGERSWLKTITGENIKSPYTNWVEHVFRAYLGLKFTFENYGPSPEMPEKCWKAILEKPGQYLPCFDQLINPAFEPVKDITHIEICIYGTENGPDLNHLCKAFECLFDLEYMIASLPQKVGEGGWVGIEGLEVVHPENPEKWELIVRSGYGAEFDYWFENRKPL